MPSSRASAPLAGVEPLIGLLLRTAGASRLWMIVSPELHELLPADELDLLAVSVVSEGELVDRVRDREGVWEEGDRILVAGPLVGLATGPATQRSPTTLAVVGELGVALAQTVSMVADFARAQAQIRELDELAVLDPLTGLRNRRHLERTLTYEVLRRRRYERSLSLIVLDLDHFKRVNDTWGHEAGDAVLLAVADVFRELLRKADVAVRYGGEEFVIILPETPAEGGFHVAERLRRAIGALDLDGVTVTASIGLASVEGRWEGDAAALIRAADQALYRAKREGRNRIIQTNLAEGSIDSSPVIRTAKLDGSR